MKKWLFAALGALALWASPAGAQQAIDLTPNALPAQNFGIVADTRWMPVLHFAALTAATSKNLAMAMDGRVIEVTVAPEAITGGTNIQFYVTVSPSGGARREICQGTLRNSAGEMWGNPVSKLCTGQNTVRKGDVLILSIQPDATLDVSTAFDVILRIAN